MGCWKEPQPRLSLTSPIGAAGGGGAERAQPSDSQRQSSRKRHPLQVLWEVGFLSMVSSACLLLLLGIWADTGGHRVQGRSPGEALQHGEASKVLGSITLLTPAQDGGCWGLIGLQVQ